MNIKRSFKLVLIFLYCGNLLSGSSMNYKVLDVVNDGRNNKNILRIGCETNCTTIFVLPPGEMIADIIEPTGKWMINCDNKRFIYVVPLKHRIHTSLDLITGNSKIYSFILEEVSMRIGNPDVIKKIIIMEKMGRIHVRIREKSDGKGSVNLWSKRETDNKYKIKDKYFGITKVADDGIFTRIYLPESQVRPAVFIRKKGKRSGYEPVRYSDSGEYYIVHRIIKKNELIVLKVGKHESAIKMR